MAEDNLPDFICPECDAGVELDWKACPNCGVELLAPEEPGPAAQPAPAKVTTLRSPSEMPAPAIAAAPAPPAQFDDIDALERDIEVAALTRTAPLTFPRKPARARRGAIGELGIVPLAAGGVGALIALNWDTWILGSASNNIGVLQALSTAGMALLAAAGAWLFFGRRRKPTAAAA